MGHNTHLRNQFKSINKLAQCYDYIITLNWRGENPSFPIWYLNGPSICETFSPLHPTLCQVWLKLAQWFWRRRSLNLDDVFLLFRDYQYFPLENDMTLYLNKRESLSRKDALSQVWLKLAQWFWRRGFLNFINVFLLFSNYHSLYGLRISTNLLQNFTKSCNQFNITVIQNLFLKKPNFFIDMTCISRNSSASSSQNWM